MSDVDLVCDSVSGAALPVDGLWIPAEIEALVFCWMSLVFVCGVLFITHVIQLGLFLKKPGTDVFYHQGSGTASQATPRGRHRIRAG
jgi:hypothetical protein